MQISIVLGLCGAAMGAVDMQPFNQAVREDPANYMAYYKRATAYLAQNNDAQALRDLSKTLELNPKFEPGLFYHARTNLRLGNTASAQDKLKQCDGRCTELLEQCNEYEQLASAAEADLKAEEWGDCVTESSQALAIAPRSLKTRRVRYECYMGLGDAAHAFVDLTDIVSQDKGDASGVSKLALFEFLINNNQDKALQLLRRCINFDPDAKQCASTSKRLRSLQKELQAPKLQFKKLLKEISDEIKELGVPEEDEQSALLASLHRKQCELYFKRGKWAQGAEVCARVRDVEPDFVPAVLLQAQLERENNNYREATELLSSLIRNGNKDPRLQALYQEIMMEYQQQRQRNYGGGGQGTGGPSQARGKDLYKVLGIDKKATKKEIKKAYRELSKKYHPDKYKGGDLTADQVMEKMQEINEAHEILGDEQRRKEYDSESSGGGRPQGGPGGFQFQGGGFPGADMNDVLRQFMRQQQGGGGGFHF